jgi:hypothetical protein
MARYLNWSIKSRWPGCYRTHESMFKSKDPRYAQKRAWQLKNRVRRNATARAWRTKNLEKCRQSSKEACHRNWMQRRNYYLLRKYGITWLEYNEMLKSQKGVCAICGNPPKNLRLAVDHEHVKGYKKLPPEEKKKFIRGLLCMICNYRYVCRGMNLSIAENVVRYLGAYQSRSSR